MVVVVCLTIRFVLPVALRSVVEPARDFVMVVAALLVLPEYLVSRRHRLDGRTPPQLAYLYGDGVARLAWAGDRAVVLVLRSLARAATTVHPIVVGLFVVIWRVAVAISE
ncbi:hypothetical protein [Amycolatopsis magusensis]|uniref:Uncharacterized protein n=1 Tax=Amycolatopsis magusensis TaxID=882444 RepID=A0ABS4Q0A5_9PSEU|nr:hypothetical protein [Amycolatopsis magusensis]MBP2184569.1 hypothetical protein [Amycolatopsis magusensis]